MINENQNHPEYERVLQEKIEVVHRLQSLQEENHFLKIKFRNIEREATKFEKIIT